MTLSLMNKVFILLTFISLLSCQKATTTSFSTIKVSEEDYSASKECSTKPPINIDLVQEAALASPTFHQNKSIPKVNGLLDTKHKRESKKITSAIFLKKQVSAQKRSSDPNKDELADKTPFWKKLINTISDIFLILLIVITTLINVFILG